MCSKSFCSTSQRFCQNQENKYLKITITGIDHRQFPAANPLSPPGHTQSGRDPRFNSETTKPSQTS